MQKALNLANGHFKNKLINYIKKSVDKLTDKKLISKWTNIIEANKCEILDKSITRIKSNDSLLSNISSGSNFSNNNFSRQKIYNLDNSFNSNICSINTCAKSSKSLQTAYKNDSNYANFSFNFYPAHNHHQPNNFCNFNCFNNNQNINFNKNYFNKLNNNAHFKNSNKANIYNINNAINNNRSNLFNCNNKENFNSLNITNNFDYNSDSNPHQYYSYYPKNSNKNNTDINNQNDKFNKNNFNPLITKIDKNRVNDVSYQKTFINNNSNFNHIENKGKDKDKDKGYYNSYLHQEIPQKPANELANNLTENSLQLNYNNEENSNNAKNQNNYFNNESTNSYNLYDDKENKDHNNGKYNNIFYSYPHWN